MHNVCISISTEKHDLIAHNSAYACWIYYLRLKSFVQCNKKLNLFQCCSCTSVFTATEWHSYKERRKHNTSAQRRQDASCKWRQAHLRVSVRRTGYSHSTLSWTWACLRLMLRPLYGAVWQRYAPIVSRVTLVNRSLPSRVSTTQSPEGMGRSLLIRDQSTGGRGLPSTRQTSSAVPPSLTLTTPPPGGTLRTGGMTGRKERHWLWRMAMKRQKNGWEEGGQYAYTQTEHEKDQHSLWIID